MSEPGPPVPTVHPDVAGLAFLLGSWTGDGQGMYPTIQAFSYREEVSFSHNGKPFLAYSQRTWGSSDGRPLHSETGYWRAGPSGWVELVIAHPTGVAEIEEGTFTGTTVEVSTRSIGLSSTAKQISVLGRSYRVDGDVLRYTLYMGAVGLPPQHHVGAELRRVG
jgi:THAP4-like, heme-binding beta-barrel domain